LAGSLRRAKIGGEEKKSLSEVKKKNEMKDVCQHKKRRGVKGGGGKRGERRARRELEMQWARNQTRCN